jgi:cobaltochelatase CobS
MDQTLNLPLSDVYVDGKTYTRSELQRLGRNELRPIARSVHATLRSTVSLTWLGSAANAADLRAFILRDKPDHEFGFASNGNGHVVSDDSDAASLMTQAIQAIAASAKNGASKAELDEVRENLEEVNDRIDRKFNEVLNFAKHELERSAKVTRIEVQDREPITVNGLRHKEYEDLLADILAFQATKQTNRANFWLVGPAGTGKTTAAEKIAEQLGLPFYFNGAIDSEYKLRGFIDAQGRVVATPFRRAYEHGGVYLFDEVDSSLPSACLAFNAALANGRYDFPGQDDPIDRSKNCIVLAASNTWGGPDGGYVGRFRQDAAFMDRFVRIPWETDEAFENELCSNKAWVAYVQSVRAKAIANGVEHLVSPRATLNGNALLAAGRPWARVVDICVRKGLNDEDWSKIK